MNKKQTKPALERLVLEHKMIKSGTYPNCSTMAKKLEVGVATVQRDITFLQDRFLAPVVYDYFHKGYHYYEEFNLGMDQLTSDDMQLLTSAKILMSHFEGSPLYKELGSILDFVTASNKDYVLINRIALPPTPKTIVDTEVWNVIFNSLKTNNVIEFDYNGLHRGSKTHRRVHPYQLLMDDGLYYLFAFSEERNAVRMFNLCRIENAVITEDNFELPENFDFSVRSKGYFGAFITSKTTRYKIKAKGIARQALKERLWSEDQKFEEHPEEKTVYMTFSSTQEEKVLHWILSQGADIEPLEPAAFVEKWKKRVLAMYSLIQGN